MTPRERHIEEIRRIEAQIAATTSWKRRKDLEKHLSRLRHELKIYDKYRRQS